ncbi:zinc finger protein 182-like isoform X2 [Leptotrombidium deliense]|uniref:Zinc finger protein 182-like isoform X2 n=1 Tax=Leptotrombidium deliense TaxID=299467 RepID=A0A443RZT2_9ACAR|nr:zinc finger protein 182-like isoform X2 [Leptotrombidium deliense]
MWDPFEPIQNLPTVGFPGAAGSTDANVAVLPPQEEQPLRRSKRIRQQRLEAIDDSDVQLNTEDAGTSRQRVTDQQLEPPAPRGRGWKRVEVAPAQPAQKPGKKRGKKPSVATLYCDICKRHFKDKRAQQQHNLRYHSGKPLLTCDKCGKSYKSISTLKQHIELVHENVGKHKCTKGCDKIFPTLKKRMLHETRFHGDNECVCGEVCEGTVRLSDHRKQCAKAQAQAQIPKEHICGLCGEELPQRSELTLHIRRKHKNVYCVICDEYFAGQNEKAKHDSKNQKE